MELDELKMTWQAFDRRLALDHALNRRLYRERRVDDVRASLRPLSVGQRMQIPIGVFTIALSAMFWVAHLDRLALVVAGIMVQVYGLALVIHAGRVLRLIRAIDHAAPVVGVQHQVGDLRRIYARGNWALGLAWWLLWIPLFLMLVAAATGIDLYGRAPSFVWVSTVVGVIGLAGSWWLHRWAHQRGRTGFAADFVDSLAGRGIVRAQAMIDDLAQFEKE